MQSLFELIVLSVIFFFFCNSDLISENPPLTETTTVVKLSNWFATAFLFFFWDGVLLLLPSLECSGSPQPLPPGFRRFSCPASRVAGITGTHHYAQLIFYIFLVETGFHHVDLDGLNLLTLWSTRLGLPKCWDYRREPPRPAHNQYVLMKQYDRAE